LKLIIIEDEPESLLGMKKAVETIDMEFTLLTSNNGEKALSIIQEEWPELIITDIMLPYMTGLELVEQVTNEDYKPQVIVVSGFNDFEYARRSIQVGAVDYLLKPFSTDEFTDKIRKALVTIREEQIYFRESNKKAEIGIRSMRDDYLTNFCLKETPLEEHLYQRLCLWKIEWLANQTYSLLVMDTKGNPDGKPLGHAYSLETFAIGNIVHELLQDYAPSILFKDPQNRWVLLTGVEDVQELSEKIVVGLKRYQKLSLGVGISSRMPAFEYIHQAYAEAMKAFRLSALSDSSDYFYQENDDIYRSDETSSPSDMAASMLDKNEEKIYEGVQYFIRRTMMSEGTLRREDITRKILNYLSKVHICLSEATSKELEEIPMKVWEAFDEYKTLEECEYALGQYLVTLSKELTPQKSNSLVERALQIISIRYKEDLTLQVIADELLMHPVWLSQLIKKETGLTFLSHLTDRRMEQVKVLLRETSLKVYEIAESVGYQDLQHFGNVFKKRTGQTPKEYRYGK
jgi:YesN/AraC family two-component response regulator